MVVLFLDVAKYLGTTVTRGGNSTERTLHRGSLGGRSAGMHALIGIALGAVTTLATNERLTL